jgi:integrase
LYYTREQEKLQLKLRVFGETEKIKALESAIPPEGQVQTGRIERSIDEEALVKARSELKKAIAALEHLCRDDAKWKAQEPAARKWQQSRKWQAITPEELHPAVEAIRHKIEHYGFWQANLVGLLQSIFSLAVDNDLIQRSPVRDRHKPRVTRHEKPVWSAEQLRLIVDSVPKTHRCLFQCAMLTGARLGELLGFQWKNINFESQTLEIRQALWEGELVSPKTEGSVRIIYFGPSLLSALTGQKQNSSHSGKDDFVFCKDDGSPLNPDMLRRDVLYPTLDRIGIARHSRAAGFHTFRHSAATIVNQKTGNLKLVQKLLGHSNLSTTADVYTHTSVDADRGAALALDQAIFGDLFQVVPRFGTWNKNAAPN